MNLDGQQVSRAVTDRDQSSSQASLPTHYAIIRLILSSFQAAVRPSTNGSRDIRVVIDWVIVAVPVVSCRRFWFNEGDVLDGQNAGFRPGLVRSM